MTRNELVSKGEDRMSGPPLRFDHIHIISRDPKSSVNWYVEMFGATVIADTVARGAPQIFLDIGGAKIVIRGQRPGEHPVDSKPIEPHSDFSSHGEWGTDHFGFLFDGDLEAFCAELQDKGVTFPVPLKHGVNGKLLCYVAAPDNVSIELMET
ncbi:MAG: VOC family protein [Hyphomicrobiaceae bacterium TMED74]|nr:MAG: VOC family protein [Hyphomicrobiaceae bacterium TMED74]